MDLNKTFSAEPMGLASYLSKENQGCIVPVFQRAYSWQRENVFRLFEDAIDGLDRLATHSEEQSIRFLGTVIAIKQPAAKVSVPRPMNQDLPNTVMTVIDGQQRLCTLVAVNILLHDTLRRRRAGAVLSTAPIEVATFVDDYLDELWSSFAFLKGSAIYPRIINAEVDQWARSAGLARYKAPISSLTWQYIAHIGGNPAPDDVFSFQTPPDPTIGHEALAAVISLVLGALDGVASGRFEQSDLPATSTLIEERIGGGDFWSNGIPEEMAAFATVSPDDAGPLLNLMAFGRFLNTRMAVTIVTTDSEDYAFDIFEALNTTGQPLTALETFKPKVVGAEAGAYASSPSSEHFDQVETYLGAYEAADSRQKATSRLLLPFALVVKGEKLGSHLNEQRRFLRNSYDALGTQDVKRRFTAAMSGTAKFLADFWDANEPTMPDGRPLADGELAFCRRALTLLHHEIVIGILARYHMEAVADPSATKLQAFEEAVKAVTAFSMLWRAGRGTSGIDSVYRAVVAGGNGIATPFKMDLAQQTPTPSTTVLRSTLAAQLGGRVPLNVKSTWIAEAVQQDLYKSNKTVAQFLLLAAHHHSAPEAGQSGLIVHDGRQEPDLMRAAAWADKRHLTLEHVAPQSNSGGRWPKGIYDDRRLPDSLGNLVHVPDTENSILSDRSWDAKRALLNIFASGTKSEASAAIAAAEAQHLTISNKVKKVAEEGLSLAMCKSLAQFSGPWDAAFIRRRGERLLSLAWDRIAPWIDL